MRKSLIPSLILSFLVVGLACENAKFAGKKKGKGSSDVVPNVPDTCAPGDESCAVDPGCDPTTTECPGPVPTPTPTVTPTPPGKGEPSNPPVDCSDDPEQNPGQNPSQNPGQNPGQSEDEICPIHDDPVQHDPIQHK